MIVLTVLMKILDSKLILSYSHSFPPQTFYKLQATSILSIKKQPTAYHFIVFQATKPNAWISSFCMNKVCTDVWSFLNFVIKEEPRQSVFAENIFSKSVSLMLAVKSQLKNPNVTM